MPAYSSKRVVLSRGSAEALGGDRLPVCTGLPQNCRTNPLKRGYPTFFSNLSSHSPTPTSSLPHADQLLHLRLEMLPAHPHVGL